MSTNGVGQNCYLNIITVANNTSALNNAEKFTLGKTENTRKLSEAKEMSLDEALE